jgi:hypothetical protein
VNVWVLNYETEIRCTVFNLYIHYTCPIVTSTAVEKQYIYVVFCGTVCSNCFLLRRQRVLTLDVLSTVRTNQGLIH